MTGTSQEKSQSEDLKGALKEYLHNYGGWGAIFRSPFLKLAVGITFILMPNWLSGSSLLNAIAIVPAMLGFSLMAFTLLLAVGDDKFRILIGAKIGDDKSIAGEVATAFLHFVVVQVIALVFSLTFANHLVSFLLSIFNSTWSDLWSWLRILIIATKFLCGGVGTLLLVYAVLLAVPAILHINEMAKAFQNYSDGEFRSLSKRRDDK